MVSEPTDLEKKPGYGAVAGVGDRTEGGAGEHG